MGPKTLQQQAEQKNHGGLNVTTASTTTKLWRLKLSLTASTIISRGLKFLQNNNKSGAQSRRLKLSQQAQQQD